MSLDSLNIAIKITRFFSLLSVFCYCLEKMWKRITSNSRTKAMINQ